LKLLLKLPNGLKNKLPQSVKVLAFSDKPIYLYIIKQSLLNTTTMTTMTITRHYTSTINMGTTVDFYGEIYFVPSRPCMGTNGLCGCGAPHSWFAFNECEPFNGQPISVVRHEVDPNTDEIIVYDRAAVLAACPAGMVPAEVVVEQYEDGRYVKVETFLN
jgi:hypothetical protein